jgi:hypothetical protein
MVVLALVLLVALMIPGLAWADHSSDDLESQFDAAAELSSYESSQWLTQQYIDGQLVRRALTQQFIDGELVRYAPGR